MSSSFKKIMPAQMNSTLKQVKHQQGFVIIMALVILLILSILGISSMSTSTMQERMSANTRDSHIAFQAAEVALRAAEREIEAGLNPPADTTAAGAGSFSTTCANGLCNCYISTATCYSANLGENYWDDASVDAWNTSANHRSYSGVLTGTSSKPIYIIEFMNYLVTAAGTTTAGGPGDPEMYRVTALGYGRTLSSRVMLQTTYKKQ